MLYSVNYVGYGNGDIHRDCFLCLVEGRFLYMWRISNVNLKKRIGKATIKRIKNLTKLDAYYQQNIRVISLKKNLLDNDTKKNIMIYHIYSSYLINTDSMPKKELWNIRKLGK